MNAIPGAYSAYIGLLVPGALALVALFLVVKVAKTIFKLAMVVVLLAALAAGFLGYQRIAPIAKAATAAAYQGRTGVTSAAAIAHAVGIPARQALAATGLNPAYVRIHVICGPTTQVQLRYADEHYMFGLLSRQWFTVPVESNTRC